MAKDRKDNAPQAPPTKNKQTTRTFFIQQRVFLHRRQQIIAFHLLCLPATCIIFVAW